MLVQRSLYDRLQSVVADGRVIMLIGARQVGKTTLLRQLTEQEYADKRVLWLNCDLNEVRNALNTTNLTELKLLIGTNDVLVIDEAQRVEQIGLTLKIIVESFPGLQVLVTGSSSMQLRNQLDEPLTGRKHVYYLYPLSTSEWYHTHGLISVKESLAPRLIYGSYPAVWNSDQPEDILMELTDSYLYKDLLEVDGLRRGSAIQKLLIALALQVGSEVSYNELSKTVGVDSKTIERYIDLLEQCFVVFRLNAFSRNIRTELVKGKKIYFYDNGIRNALIRQFAPIALRNDVGALWENFFIAERLKENHYSGKHVNSYFWRTTGKQEIDYIEEYDGRLHAYEMKWNSHRQTTSLPKSFVQTYSPATATVVTPDNYIPILL